MSFESWKFYVFNRSKSKMRFRIVQKFTWRRIYRLKILFSFIYTSVTVLSTRRKGNSTFAIFFLNLFELSFPRSNALPHPDYKSIEYCHKTRIPYSLNSTFKYNVYKYSHTLVVYLIFEISLLHLVPLFLLRGTLKIPLKIYTV